MNLSKIHYIAIIVSDYEASKDFIKGEDLTLLLIINSKRTSTWVVSSLFLAIRFRYSTFVLVYLICTAKVLIFV